MKLNESFGYIINRTARNMKKSLDVEIKRFDITTSQWSILKLLSEQDDLTQVEIAEKLSSDKATTGSVIDKLANKKLVYREQCENDRRAYRICMSPYGRELVDRLSYEAGKCNKKALEGFNENEVQQLVEYLHRIDNNLIKEVK